MKTLDLATWPRRRHHAFFRRLPYPVYNLCFDLDVTGLRQAVAARGGSFMHAVVHLSMQAVNAPEGENFRLRQRGDDVVLHERVHPSFTTMPAGSDLFHIVTTDHLDDPVAFDAHARERSAAQVDPFPSDADHARDDLVFLSSIPWVRFTAITHVATLQRDDTIPRLSWGRWRSEGGRLVMPYSVQASHLFVDGVHIGRLHDALQQRLAAFTPR